MTAWAFVAASGLAMIALARAASGDDAGKADADATPTVASSVKLEIQITGLGSEGAKVSIKPAHPGCQFKVVEKTIPRNVNAGVVRLTPITVSASTTAADRDCSFAITVTEPGRPPKTFRRGLQLSASDPKTAKVQALKCYLSATEVAARDDAKTAKPRR
jgi:hypothetical protein